MEMALNIVGMLSAFWLAAKAIIETALLSSTEHFTLPKGVEIWWNILYVVLFVLIAIAIWR